MGRRTRRVLRGRARALRRVAMAAALLAAGPVIAGSAAASHATADLPLLVVLHSPDLYVGTATETPTVLADNEIRYGCDPYEQQQEQARRCLRFDTMVANLGAGALELRYSGTGAAAPDGMPAMQRIYRSDGTHLDRRAGRFYLDPAHGHFHYANFALASLWRSDRGGHRLGRHPVRTGRKDGFCLEDLGPYSARAGRPARAYTYPTACYPTVQPDDTVTQVNGISPGYLDVYDETLTNQSIVIDDLADGYYLLQITVDPTRTLRLDPRSQLTSTQLVRLCGDHADWVGHGDGCRAAHRGGTTARPDPLEGQRWRRSCRDGWCLVVPAIAARPSIGWMN